jgi:hypothetical protein
VRGAAAQAGQPSAPPGFLEQNAAPSGPQSLKVPSTNTNGQFSGTMVSLKCSAGRPPGVENQCAATDHYYSLKVDAETVTMLPLLAGDPKVLAELKSDKLDGKEVVVTGTQSSTTGAILVSSIEPRGGVRASALGHPTDDLSTSER